MNWKTLLLIAALFFLALLAGRFFSSAQLGSSDTTIVTELDAVWCEPAVESCEMALPTGGKLSMRITPVDAILPMKPLTATVSMPKTWQAMRLEAIGLNMEMGINRFSFTTTAQGEQQSAFLLPLCTLTRMEWQLSVMISDGSSSFLAPFRFVIER